MHVRHLGFAKVFSAAAALSLSLAASADTWTDTDTGYTWTYTVADGKATIEKYTGEYYVPAVSPEPTGVLTIPATLGGKPVTAIGTEAFYGCDALTDVSFPASVTSIGSRAFAYTALTDVTIPGTVKSIGVSAFTSCESLKKVTIGDGVESIGEGAFDYCSALTDVTIPDSVTSIGSRAFQECNSLVNVTLGDGLTEIGEGMFDSCASLTQVTIPASVTSIGNSAFYSCDALTDVTIPENLAQIGTSAFNSCSALTEMTIPASVTSIGYYAFHDTALATVHVAKGDTARVKKMLEDSGCNTTGVTFDDPGAQTWTDPDTGLTWHYAVEDGKATLENVSPTPTGVLTIPATLGGYPVTTIGRSAFGDCDALTDVSIPASVTSIEDWAFLRCEAITSMVIPDSVTSIGYMAFYECSKLETIQIPNSVTSIGYSAFSSCALKTVEIPDSVTEIGKKAFDYCHSLVEVKLPAGIKEIPAEMFYSCSNLRTVTIPDGVTTIGHGAFGSCTSLAFMTIPAGVTSIKWWAFDACDDLYAVAIPASVVEIEEDAFRACDELKFVYVAAGDTARVKALFEASGFDTASVAFVEESMPKFCMVDFIDSVAGDSFKAYAEGALLENMPEPKKTGYTFDGWFTAKEGGTQVTAGTEVTHDVSYYAHWTKKYLSWTDSDTGIEWTYRVVDGEAEIYNDDIAAIPDTTAGNVVIPSTLGGYPVTRIGDGAFSDCYSITGVTIPDSVTEIGDGAFYGCEKLADANGFVILRDTFHYYCGSAATVVVPDGVRKIGYYAFWGCDFLTSVTIPDSVTSIGEQAFAYCYYLGEATIPRSVKYIGDYAFDYTALATVHVVPGDADRVKALLEASGFDTTGVAFVEDLPAPTLCMVTLELNGGSGIETSFEVEPGTKIGLLPIPDGYDDGIYKYHNFYGWFWDAGFTDEVEPTDVVSGDCTCYAKWGLSPDLQTTVVDGIAWSYFEVGKTVTLYNNGRSVIPSDYEGSLTIPAKIAGKTVAGIGMCAFYGCTGLTSVIIPDGVEDISDKAFAWCENLQVVQFGKGVSNGTIFDQAFKGCSRLRALDFKATKSVYAVEDAFEDAGTLTVEGKPCVYVPKSAAKTWGDKWMGMRVLAYPFQVQFIMGIMPGKASYGTVTPIPYGPATEIGKKVTLKAKANKTYVFAGWYDCDWNDSENPDKQVLVSRAPSYSYTVTGEFKHFKADFVKEEEDIASLAINVADVRTAGDGSVTIDIGAAVDSYSEPKITLKGLPQGLKYDTKTMTVTGKATKPGVYTVTISATNASQKKAKSADFTITVPNFTDALIGVEDSYGPFVPGAEYAQQIPGAADCAVAGLPSGMKWTAKDVVDSKTKLVTVPANSFYGAAAKPGNYTVTFTKTVKELDAKGKQVSVKHTATSTFVVGPFPKLTIETVGASGKDKVSGAGEYAANKKVSLKATPDGTKGAVKVFMGWYDAWDNLLSRAASYSYVMPEVDTTLTAKFITQAEDAAHVAASLSGVGDFDKDNVEAYVELYCGVYKEWTLDVGAWSQTTVKVTGLPSGLKFTAKDVVDSKTKKVTVPANTIYGTPTAPSKTDRVTGDYVPYDIKITITTSGKTVVDYTVKAMVYPVAAGMYGTFDGGGDAGQATLTVSAVGKISGKYLSGGLVWTLAAPYFDTYTESPNDACTATVEAKCGKDTATLDLAIQRGEAGAEATLWDDGGFEIARLRLNNWKIMPYSTVAKLFAKAPGMVLDAVDDDGTPGTLSLKFTTSGTVTGKGDFTTGTDARGKDVKYQPSFSAPLVATSFPYRISPDTEEIGFTAKAYIYLPLDAKKGFAGMVKIVEFEFDGKDFILK